MLCIICFLTVMRYLTIFAIFIKKEEIIPCDISSLKLLLLLHRKKYRTHIHREFNQKFMKGRGFESKIDPFAWSLKHLLFNIRNSSHEPKRIKCKNKTPEICLDIVPLGYSSCINSFSIVMISMSGKKAPLLRKPRRLQWDRIFSL